MKQPWAMLAAFVVWLLLLTVWIAPWRMPASVLVDENASLRQQLGMCTAAMRIASGAPADIPDETLWRYMMGIGMLGTKQ